MTDVMDDRAQPDEDPTAAARAAAVKRAVKVWTGELVDLTGRNNLLFFRDLRAGTLHLADADAAAVAAVLTGRTVALSRLFDDEEARADALKRARTVRNKADEHFEERGLQTLYLACGMTTWSTPRGAAVPAAPVLLCPVRLVPRGAAQDDFDLAVTGDLEVNPTLLHKLAADFDCHCDPDELLDRAGIEGAIDTPEELTAVYEWLGERAASVPGFAVAPRLVLGNFSYAKLPMVQDLEQALEALIAHDLIAAIAGHEPARAALAGAGSEVSISDSDHVPLADEFLVLDADASQSYVINAAVAGQNLIVKGPPGTGKSQTIANLIASLMARGQKVLFVAEKRAAIDAVLQRLQHRGLDDLVLDLHGGAGSRRKIAQALSSTLAQNAAIPRLDVAAEQQRVEARRTELNERVAALHDRRPPWDVTVHDAQVRLLGLDAQTALRFRGPVLEGLSAEAYEQCRGDLDRYVGLGGLAIEGRSTPWATGTVVSGEEAQAAHALAGTLAHQTLPGATAALKAAARQTGLRVPEAVQGWSEHVGLWEAVARTLEIFEAELFEQDLAALHQLLAPMGQGSVKRATATMTSGAFRTARKRLRELLREGQSPGQAELHALLGTAAEQQSQWQALSDGERPPLLPTDLAALAAQLTQLLGECAQLDRFAGGQPLAAMAAAALRARLDALLADHVTLAKLPELHRLRTALTRLGQAELLEELAADDTDADRAVAVFEHAWLQSVLEAITFADPRIGAFDGQQHLRAVEEFRAGDQAHIETAAQRVRRLCAERAVQAQDEFEQEAALVQYQAGLKRKHLSIRQLFSGAPNVLTALRPCWAMSPLVVSQLLPADQQYFDVVIFDEASQITPADAIPAILRAKRLVVAGDDRQLPPTAFFNTTSESAESEPEDPTQLVVGRDFESILDALGAFVTPRMLTWHYRSHDERLIAFSNAHFYDRALTTFPGVTGDTCLAHELVPFEPGQIGSEQSASAEVVRVVELVLEHARQRPDESLGVIAMGIKHAQRIDEHLRARLAGHPELEAFFDEGREEKFFVKNLERVQGDERDVIILSVGYGKSPDGRLLYRFGPLNQQGGERRLNVAVTRAKKRMTLVSSFSAADMDPNRSTAEGVRLLRSYLQYAESRGRTLGDGAMDKPALNPFEIDVRDALTRAGIPLVAQYGCSGYWIDFAAQHPIQPGRMVLAIECDGAAYHSSPTARDRDRLRQQQLERLGWRFHRIWSQDWFHGRESEIERAVAAYQAAVADAERPVPEPPATSLVEPNAAQPAAVAPVRGPMPFTPSARTIDEYTPAQIAQIVRWVESDTLLRTHDQLLAEVIRVLGFQKRGKKIVAAIEAAISQVRNGRPAPVATAPVIVQPPAKRRRANGIGSLALADAALTVLDVETTGLSPRGHRILEIALVRVEPDGQIGESWTTLLDPQRDLGATHIHGIRPADIAGAPRFEQIAGDVVSRIAGSVIVAHNARFDASFLRAEFERAGVAIPTLAILCTLGLSHQLDLPLTSRRLADCCAYFGIDGFNAHSALGDAQGCARLATQLLRLAEQHGHTNLDDLDCQGPAPPSAWPPLAPSGLVHVRRSSPAAVDDDGIVARLIRRLPPAPGAGIDATAYLEVLDRALADRRLTPAERDDLAAVATELGLDAKQIAALHDEYLAGLVAAAEADGIVTDEEQRDLDLVSELLGSPRPDR
jgi:DNA polymerase III epsilon subunit-like protein/very-short-patch-repair endonuclease